MFFTYLWNSPWVSFLKGDLQFSKLLKNTICIGLCKLKCTEKRFIPFSPLHFLPEFVPHTEFKGRPEDTTWNVLYHTAFRNYAAISLQVPSILSILLGAANNKMCSECHRGGVYSTCTNCIYGGGGGGRQMSQKARLLTLNRVPTRLVVL